jgi:outer membrane protein TolC
MRSLRFIALVALPGQIAFGQQASPAARGNGLSLDDAIATAHRNNPAFLQIENNLRNSEATVRQAYAALLPSSNASFSTRYQQGGTQFVQGVRSAPVVTPPKRISPIRPRRCGRR